MSRELLFVPLTKVDLVKREVWGVAAQETADKSGEIMDYATSKPNFVKWSAGFEKATEGKSKGNVREMHGKSAAGKLDVFECNDVEKRFEICAKVVDDAAWKKVTEGVYTGFSIGGSYEKKWKDGDLMRYTASPSEVSLVDNPCIPTATFTMVKADGMQEEVAFKSVKVEKKLKKGMFGVQDLARVIGELRWCAEDSKNEAMYEGDNSEVPAKLNEALKTLGAILVQMAQEEVAELTPKEDDMSEASEKMLKMLEGIDARLTKMEAAKPAEEVATAKVEQATDAETGTVTKDKVAPAAEDDADSQQHTMKMMKVLEDMAARLEKMEKQPALDSSKLPVVTAIAKNEDGKVKVEKSFDKENPLDLVKMAHTAPKFLSKSDLGDYMGVSGARAN